MKSFRKELWFETPGRRAFLNITPQVEAALKEGGVQEGIALINAMHITASVFINDDEQGLHADYETWLETLAPHEPVSGYHHNRTGEDNADAHMKRQIMGREVVVAITPHQLVHDVHGVEPARQQGPAERGREVEDVVALAAGVPGIADPVRGRELRRRAGRNVGLVRHDWRRGWLIRRHRRRGIGHGGRVYGRADERSQGRRRVGSHVRVRTSGAKDGGA